MFPVDQLGHAKDLDWKERTFERLQEFLSGAELGANTMEALNELIKESGLKAIPALHNCVFFNIYKDILLVCPTKLHLVCFELVMTASVMYIEVTICIIEPGSCSYTEGYPGNDTFFFHFELSIFFFFFTRPFRWVY